MFAFGFGGSVGLWIWLGVWVDLLASAIGLLCCFVFAGEFGWWGLRGRFGSGVDPVCVFRCCLFVGCSVGSYLVLVLTSVVCYFLVC